MKSTLLFIIPLVVVLTSYYTTPAVEQTSLLEERIIATSSCGACIPPELSATPISSFCGAAGTFSPCNSRYTFCFNYNNSLYISGASPGCVNINYVTYAISFSGIPNKLVKSSYVHTFFGNTASGTRCVMMDFDTASDTNVTVCMSVQVAYQGGTTCYDTICETIFVQSCC